MCQLKTALLFIFEFLEILINMQKKNNLIERLF